MSDLFGGPSAEDFNEANRGHVTNWIALCLALEKKGIVTLEEIEECRILAIHLVDQASAQKRSESELEL